MEGMSHDHKNFRDVMGFDCKFLYSVFGGEKNPSKDFSKIRKNDGNLDFGIFGIILFKIPCLC